MIDCEDAKEWDGNSGMDGLLRNGSSCGVGGVHPFQVTCVRPEIPWLA